jgi:hypothetical protein
MLASFPSMARELFFLSPCRFVDEYCLAGLFLFHFLYCLCLSRFHLYLNNFPYFHFDLSLPNNKLLLVRVQSVCHF